MEIFLCALGMRVQILAKMEQDTGNNGQEGNDLLAALQSPDDLPPALVPVETINDPVEGKCPNV